MIIYQTIIGTIVTNTYFSTYIHTYIHTYIAIAFKTAYYAFEQCSKIKPIMLKTMLQ